MKRLLSSRRSKADKATTPQASKAAKPQAKQVAKPSGKSSPATKKPATKKVVAKKTAAKKSAVRKAVAKKAVAKKASAQKTAAKKTIAKKPAARKQVAKKTAASKPAAKKPAVKRPATKKAAPKKPPAKRSTARMPAPRRAAVQPPPKPKPTALASAAKAAMDKERKAEERQQEQFQQGTQLFQARKFGQARRVLERVQQGPNAGLSHRAGVFVEICLQHAAPKRPVLESIEDYYNHGVQLMNDGSYDDALRVLNRGLAKDPDAAHLHYVKGVAQVLSGDLNAAGRSIRRAIELDDEIRLLARRDPDLRTVIEVSPFVELVADPDEE